MENSNILVQLILISAFCVGWHILIQEGKFLHFIGIALSRTNKWIAKPLGACLPCSASIVGGAAYMLLNYGGPIGLGLVLIVGAVGLNDALYHLYAYISQLVEEMEYRLIPRRNQSEMIERAKKQLELNNCKTCGNGEDNKDKDNTVGAETEQDK